MPQKGKWQHLDFGQRKTIANMVAQGKAASEIAQALGVDPATVSREVLRNRTRNGPEDQGCPRNRRFPHVCADCPLRYKKSKCGLARWSYDASSAQAKADARLVRSRQGLDITREQFEALDAVVAAAVARGESIYQCLKAAGIDYVSVQTVYRWIRAGLMTVKRIDLPKAAKYKVRKKKKAEYDYGGASASGDKEGKHFRDYLAWQLENPGAFHCEMDYLGAPKGSSFAALTISIPVVQVVFAFKLPKASAEAVASLFDRLEKALGAEAFAKVFGVVLTDNDPAFSDWKALEFSRETGERRCRMFFADAFRSNQKAHIENKNGQLRRFFPKGEPVDGRPESFFAEAIRTANRSHAASVDGRTPEETFAFVFGQEAYDEIVSVIAGA